MCDVQVVGKCGICGGRVTVPTIFWSVIPPVPTCESCGAVMDQTINFPTVPMKPSRRRINREDDYFLGKKINNGWTKEWSPNDPIAMWKNCENFPLCC